MFDVGAWWACVCTCLAYRGTCSRPILLGPWRWHLHQHHLQHLDCHHPLQALSAPTPLRHHRLSQTRHTHMYLQHLHCRRHAPLPLPPGLHRHVHVALPRRLPTPLDPLITPLLRRHPHNLVHRRLPCPRHGHHPLQALSAPTPLPHHHRAPAPLLHRQTRPPVNLQASRCRRRPHLLTRRHCRLRLTCLLLHRHCRQRRQMLRLHRPRHPHCHQPRRHRRPRPRQTCSS